MKIITLLWLVSLLVACSAKKGTDTSVRNITVRALSSHSLQVTWEPPLISSHTLVSYSLVFFAVQSHQKTRTHVELFVNQLNLTKLRPGTRYKIKLAPVMKNGPRIMKGAYSIWVNARTPEDNKTRCGHSPYSTVGPPSSSQVPRHCSRIGELCKNIGYLTQMPNYFKQQYQDDAEHELSQFTRMIQSNCSSELHVFLCSLYFPPCVHNVGRVTLPCRSVCEKARRDCQPWMRRSGLKWPYKFNCSGFPRPRDRACVRKDGTFTQVPSHCQELQVDMCKGLGYSYVQMPNFFHDNLQRDAASSLMSFSQLVKTNCSLSLQFFLCLLHVPPCVVQTDSWSNPIPPCREICEDARRGCEPLMMVIGLTWPAMMDCSRFPWFERNGSDVCVKQEDKPTTVPNTPQAQTRCEPLRIPVCKSLNYTQTILPNFHNHSSQEEVRRALKEFKPHWDRCSNQMKRFVCFLLVPYCTLDGTPLPPCQTFCEKMKTDCGYTSTLLANLNCSRFPTLSPKRLCFGDPLTTMDCVGPRSRPCKVNSTTLPVILKCSSPGNRFTIDEIKILLYDRTNVLVPASRSEALEQCDQTHQQLSGRHECQFNINYDILGIDELLVRSVAVKYHCLLD